MRVLKETISATLIRIGDQTTLCFTLHDPVEAMRPALRFTGVVVAFASIGFFGIFCFVHVRDSGTRKALARDQYRIALSRYASDKNRSELKSALLSLRELDPLYAQPCFQLALLAEAEEDWPGAIKWFTEFRHLKPRSAESAVAQIELNRLPQIEVLDSTPLGKQKRRYDDAIARCNLLLEEGFPKEAVAGADAAARIDPSRWEAYSFAAVCLEETHHFNLAERLLKRAILLAPARRKVTLETALRLCGKEDQAAALALNADKALRSRHFKIAAEQFDKAWELAPEKSEYGLGAAVAQLKLHNRAAASKDLMKLKSCRDSSIASRAHDLLVKVNSESTPNSKNTVAHASRS
jgi:tetratricopeptide (TPR) repeat protein